MTRLYNALGAAAAVLTLLIAAGLVAGFFLPAKAAAKFAACGTASWYGTESGSKTATGEPFDGSSMTAAMPDRSHLGERYRVHLGRNHVDVRINDVGPRKDLHRIMDLSFAAHRALGMGDLGHVCLEKLH